MVLFCFLTLLNCASLLLPIHLGLEQPPSIMLGYAAKRLNCVHNMIFFRKSDRGHYGPPEREALTARPEAGVHGGPSPRLGYATPYPLPPLRAHLVTKGRWLLAIHMVAPNGPKILSLLLWTTENARVR